jgi:hypothetical protein
LAKNVTVVARRWSTKIFSNGGLQMTGIRTEAGGREAARFTAEIVHDLGLLEERRVDFVSVAINSDMRSNVLSSAAALAEAWRHDKDVTPFSTPSHPALKLLYFYS